MFEELYMNQPFEDEGDFLPLVTVEEDGEAKEDEHFPQVLPILALKNTVLFPGIVIPITVGRDKSIKALNKAYKGNKYVGVLSQQDTNLEDPEIEDLFKVGCIAKILKIIKMPDGSTTAILQGRKRFNLVELISKEPFMEGTIAEISYIYPSDKLQFEALISSILDLAKQIIELSPNIPSEAVIMLKNMKSPSFLLNFIASNLGSNIVIKQKILEMNDLAKKANRILELMHEEFQLLEIKDQIESKVRVDIEKQQRDYFLNQQLKTIQEELGQNPQEEEVTALLKRAQKMQWPQKVRNVFDKEIQKLRRTNPQIAEYSIQLNYLDLLLDLPWEKTTKDNFNLQKVKSVLDKDHYGLEKVKERILEHLAVLKLKGDLKAPILCLVGPPGVGKTSLGKSISNALKRKFIRISLGGLHDESEIRGHRKTYIGAMPGRIIQSFRKTGANNPVFILDEIDKVGKDFRGDPSSALLEVLDPEQNSTFHDNYLDIEYDLSKTLFIATANSLNTIQPALLDRMEIIQISGYSLEEKVQIAKKHLIPQLREEHGLKPNHVKLSDAVIKEVIQNYTRESGVRNLNRQLAGIMRNIAKKVAMEEMYDFQISVDQVAVILGPTRYSNDQYEVSKHTGVAVGLAWTEFGGDILFIESSLSQGKGKLTLTGNLGDVMKESAIAGLSFLKANAQLMGIDPEIFEKTDIHLHVPEGAIPKDGPSAGITMVTALTSAFTKKKVKSYLAMTGEITLRGKVLPVGGIKEKILAAKRAGMKEIILCQENKKHVEEIEKEYIKGIVFHYVRDIHDVLKIALG
jgi:ATP-dependent Lon protease